MISLKYIFTFVLIYIDDKVVILLYILRIIGMMLKDVNTITHLSQYRLFIV